MDKIEICGVSKVFGKTRALDDVSATISPGEITGLVGADGAGKTTLLRIICGLLLADGGSASVCGEDPARDPARVHELVGYMPQKFGLYEDLSVMENLELYANLRDVPKSERASRFERLLAFTRLAPFTSRLAGALSGGMKQKLGLACTLLAEPRVILLDEPGVGVDPVARRELWAMVRELATEERIVVWSTAYLNEAEACDSTVLLNEGKLLYHGCPDELSARSDGKVFFVAGAGALRRSLIVPLLNMDATVDAVIQGDRVRVVTRDGGRELASSIEGVVGEASSRAKSSERARDISIAGAPPRFEDSFMDILGGARRPKDLMEHLFKNKIAGEPREIVRADSLTKRFGSFVAVDGISFSIKQGEIFGLLGPNGAGKSTTFKMMCGLLMPTDGACSLVGIDFRRAPGRARSRLGYMAQRFSLYGDLTVRQNLIFFSGIYGMRGAAQRDAVDLVVDAFEFGAMIDAPSASLPLGFKQRLSLACAIMHGPDALFLDEPTSGVDPAMRREFWTYINAVVELGVTVLVTTHFMDEAEYCDRIALVYRGQAIASGTPDDLRSSVATSELADPTMEDAFIELIERSDRERAARGEDGR